jgi:hypothetical protein
MNKRFFLLYLLDVRRTRIPINNRFVNYFPRPYITELSSLKILNFRLLVDDRLNDEENCIVAS